MVNLGARQAKFLVMDCPICNCFRTKDPVAMDPVWRFPEQGAFTRAYVLRPVSDYLGRDGGYSEEIIVL